MQQSLSAERRAKVAAHANTHGIRAAMEEFGVSQNYVYRALREAELPASNCKIPTTAFGVLAKLLDGWPQQRIAQKMHISKQRVSQIAIAARNAGIRIEKVCS